MHVRLFGLQEKVRSRKSRLNPVDTLLNSADLGTKYHGGKRLRELMRLLPLCFATGAKGHRTEKEAEGLLAAPHVSPLEIVIPRSCPLAQHE
eukprot:599661-Amphidinium_carterae.1